MPASSNSIAGRGGQATYLPASSNSIARRRESGDHIWPQCSRKQLNSPPKLSGNYWLMCSHRGGEPGLPVGERERVPPALSHQGYKTCFYRFISFSLLRVRPGQLVHARDHAGLNYFTVDTYMLFEYHIPIPIKYKCTSTIGAKSPELSAVARGHTQKRGCGGAAVFHREKG